MTSPVRRSAAGIALVVFLGQAGGAIAADPVLPPGQDPGGTALALIGPGFDYLAEGIVQRLARDGEGELIGWDFVDGDRTPYATAGADGTGSVNDAPARALLATYSHSRLVPIRVPESDPQALAKAIAFAAGTPARIIALALPLHDPQMRLVVKQASTRFRDHLFVVAGALPVQQAPSASDSSGDQTAAADAASLINLGNVLVVASAAEIEGRSARALEKQIELVVLPRGATMFGAPPGAPPRSDAEAVAMAAASAACQEHGGEPLAGSAAKAAAFDAARPLEGSASLRLLDPLCFYGGRRL